MLAETRLQYVLPATSLFTSVFFVLSLPFIPHRQVVGPPLYIFQTNQTTNYTDQIPVHLKVLFPFLLNKFVIFVIYY
jgi:hypothetical protein